MIVYSYCILPLHGLGSIYSVEWCSDVFGNQKHMQKRITIYVSNGGVCFFALGHFLLLLIGTWR